MTCVLAPTYSCDVVCVLRNPFVTVHPCATFQVTRAEALLRNLEQERDRWSMSSESFTKQLQSLIGDGLLAAAFVTYVGVFDYRTRKVLSLPYM